MMYCKKLKTPLRVSGRRFELPTQSYLLPHGSGCRNCMNVVIASLKCLAVVLVPACWKVFCAVLHAPVFRLLSAASAPSLLLMPSACNSSSYDEVGCCITFCSLDLTVCLNGSTPSLYQSSKHPDIHCNAVSQYYTQGAT